MALSAHITALRAIDSHTGGEPTRLIVEGFPDLGEGSMGIWPGSGASDGWAESGARGDGQ